MTEAEGIKLLHDAGLDVFLRDKDFDILDNGKKIFYFSSRKTLTVQKSLLKNVIISRSFHRGYDKGREAVQKEIKNALGIGA